MINPIDKKTKNIEIKLINYIGIIIKKKKENIQEITKIQENKKIHNLNYLEF